jgi:MFS family permease
MSATAAGRGTRSAQQLGNPKRRADGEGAPRTIVGGRYAWYVLGVLFIVYVFNFVDRQIISILAQDIKAGLGLGDAQIGYLYGTAFAIFYALFGIPLGRLADSWYRVRLIGIGLTVWSGMTALSGFASSYAQLAVARVGVGVGEASASPAAYSLLGDYFPHDRRAFALAIYSSGLFVGAGLSLPLGGWVAHTWSQHFPLATAPLGLAGWQAAFLAVGIPGLLLALWVVTLREPPRGIADGTLTAARRPEAWREFGHEVAAILPPFTLWSVSRFPGALRANLLLLAAISTGATLLTIATGDLLQWCTMGLGAYAVSSWVQKLRATDRPTYALLWGTPAVRYALVGFACITFVSYSLAFWMPPYAIRTFGLRIDVAGIMIGVPAGFAAAVGCVAGGRLSDVWRRGNPRGRIYACMLALALPPPIILAAVSTRDVRVLYLLAPLSQLASNMWLGSGAAALQEAVLPRMRGTAAATLFLATSLGLAVGPYFAGRVSVLTGSLRTGILSIFIVSPLALFLLWRASRALPAAEAGKHSRAAAAGEPLGSVAAT